MSVELFQGDCVEVLKTISNDIIDLTVTSPPYDNLRKYKGFSWDFEATACELYRVTKPGGVVVWVVGDATIKGSETGTSFRQALYFKECGFNLHDTMIYEKVNYMPTETKNRKRYPQAFEYMFIVTKGSPLTFNVLKIPKRTNLQPGKFRCVDGSLKNAYSPASVGNAKAAPNIWRYGVGQTSHGHPATFPERLAKDHIMTWSNLGDLVLDPFLGSGTTGKMAKLLGRNFIGIDISAEYVELARQRIANVSGRDMPANRAELTLERPASKAGVYLSPFSL